MFRMASFIGSAISSFGLGSKCCTLIGMPQTTRIVSVFDHYKIQARFRHHSDKITKGPVLPRYGYNDKLFQGGLLPREAYVGSPLPIPDYKPKNVWNEKRALFGQNDYIDILGPQVDGTKNPLLPSQVLYNIPPWLRGFNGNEYQVLLRRRKFVQNKGYPLSHPTKWTMLNKRIKKLYVYLNRKTKSPYWANA